MFDLIQDPGTTGRLEVLIYPNYRQKGQKEGITIHAKSKGQGYPSSNWEAFLAKVDAAIK